MWSGYFPPTLSSSAGEQAKGSTSSKVKLTSIPPSLSRNLKMMRELSGRHLLQKTITNSPMSSNTILPEKADGRQAPFAFHHLTRGNIHEGICLPPNQQLIGLCDF